jgi:hypothetical protein
MGPQLNLNDIGRNCLLGNRKKIAKFLMRTFTCCSTFLYGSCITVLHEEKVEIEWPIYVYIFRPSHCQY